MLNKGRFPIILAGAGVLAFAGWNIIFRNDVWMQLIGIDGLRMIVGATSAFWLIQAFRKDRSRQKPFWLLLCIGVLLYVAVSIWSIYPQITAGSLGMTDATYILWLSSNCFFLAALIYKTKDLGSDVLKKHYFFNILMFIIAAASISIHYLIVPILVEPGFSLAITLVTIIYPIVDFGILFAITILYYESQKGKQKNLMLYIVLAFFIMVVIDSFYTSLSVQGHHDKLFLLEIFWMISILLIGLAGFYSREAHAEDLPEITNLFEGKSVIFPYSAMLVLMVIVIVNYQIRFNALSLGLLISFFTLLGRQVLIIRTNQKLMGEFKHLAFHDTLTGLSNRVSFKEKMNQTLTQQDIKKAALLLIDLDRFKVINDTLGHDVGDQVLIQAAKRLDKSLNGGASLYRLGGDEFVILFPDATDKTCLAVAETVILNFQQSFLIQSYELNVTPSIGISMYPENGKTSEELLKYADAAMYLSKDSGRNRYSFYDTELHDNVSRKMIIETELKNAIEKNQFSVHYQQKVDMAEDKTIGVEALLRWHHPALGWVSPAEFIPIAEEIGQIIPIGEWVLEMACKQNKLWQDKGLPPLYVAVNVSVLQFQQGKFLDTVKRVLNETGLDARYLELEITESIMKDTAESIALLVELRKLGVAISIDDFGTGYSSLHVLPNLPIDTIKIDKSFIDDIDRPEHHSMLKAIIDLCLTLEMNVIAEGIETPRQMAILLENNCRLGQGYLFSKPLPAQAFEERLQQESENQLKFSSP